LGQKNPKDFYCPKGFLKGKGNYCSGATHFISPDVSQIAGVKVRRTSQAEQLQEKVRRTPVLRL